MKETDLWARINGLKWPFAEREEPGSTNVGLPDMLLVGPDGVTRFVENKIAVLDRDLKGGGTFICRSPGVRPSQVRWHVMFQKASPHSYFLIGVRPDQVYVVSGAYVRELKREDPLLHRAVLVTDWSVDGLIRCFDAVAKLEKVHVETLGDIEDTPAL